MVCELRDRINAIEANDNLARALIYFVPAILDEPHMRLVREAHAFSWLIKTYYLNGDYVISVYYLHEKHL
jgi:hypothetical protein